MKLKTRVFGEIDIDEIGLPVTNGGLVLPCGYSARWVKR